ncbi:hypothetical protein AA12717_2812 [Gluconacetobacter sacchari DSM 12717]|uniref:Phosphatidate cytidylyltransferase n=2 Tax=Gluconacetobacter sacchari TaxID=92759 RepID=A0A7W4IFR0_9PROT|nr:hypothetical protein [Gluconacetobacter sacchari]GBQ27905.1 hypothetical protein AA12717_2812 [Gluconacetobacter sacchari DSM 12717]
MDDVGRDSFAAGRVARILAEELIRPVVPEVTAFVAELVRGTRVLGVLFYGSGLRQVDPEGVLDFYIVLDRQADWPRGGVAREANALLPPNVEYHERMIDGRGVRAKVAILTIAQFRALTARGSLDTTVWARFCQPARLVWVRDAAAADAILGCLIRAVAVAAWWAAVLGPDSGMARDFWEALFRRTYAAELRVEGGDRSIALLAGNPGGRFDALLPAAWAASGLRFVQEGDRLCPAVSAETRARAGRQWRMRAELGRPLNVARLFKAAFTFVGGARYIAWKIRRHRGFDLALTPFEARHPLVCLPWLLWRLKGSGMFRR